MAVKSYIVELKDQVSGAAKSAAAWTRTLQSAMGGLMRDALKLDALGKIDGLEKLDQKIAKMYGVSLPSFKAGVEAAAVGVVALGAAAAGAVAYAIDASEHLEHMRASFEALAGGAPGAGQKVVDAVRGIAAELPQSERTVQSWAQGLMAVGVTDMGVLRGNLQAIAGAEALVAGGGERVRSVLERLNEASMKGTKVRFSIAQLAGTGVTEQELLGQLGMSPRQLEVAKKQATLTGGQIADALSRAINAKSAGALAASNREIGTVLTKAKDQITHLFEGIDTAGLGASLADFFSIFDQSLPSGQAVKAGIGGAITWVMGKLEEGLRSAKHFFLYVELYSLIAYNKLRPFTGLIKAGLIGGIVALAVLGIPALAATAVAAWSAAAAFIALNLPIIAIAAAIGLVTAAVVYFWPEIKKAALAVEEFAVKGWNAAVDFVAGMIKGIVDGTARVVSSVEKLGGAAWDAVKRTLHLGSPSRLMITAGLNMAEGLAIGQERGTPRAASAAGAMAGTTAMAAVSAGAARGGGGSSVTNNKFEVHIKAKDDATAQELLSLFEEQVHAIAERIALSQGVAPVPT